MSEGNFEQYHGSQEIGHEQCWFFIEKIESFRPALLPVTEERGLWPHGHLTGSDYWRHRDLSGQFSLADNKELSIIIAEEEVRLDNVLQKFRVHAATMSEYFNSPNGKNKIVTSYSVTQEMTPEVEVTTNYSSKLYCWDENEGSWKKVRTRLEEMWHTLAKADRERGESELSGDSFVAWFTAYCEEEGEMADIGLPNVFTQDRFNEIMDVLEGLGR
jgi:hypothetical protein